MFSNVGDGGRGFLSTGGSKLGSIFGGDNANDQEDASFTYTAPKQPKKKDPSQEGLPPAVVVSNVVHAYKYINDKYASQGNLGVALLASQAAKDYRILLFVNRQQQVTSANITSSFVFTIHENNYASFQDGAGQMWSVMFDAAGAVEKFAKEVAMAKANSGPLTQLIQQDLSLGEGRAIESGDSVEVNYIGWLLRNGNFGKVFDQSGTDSPFRFKVGKGKVVKGWDQGMLGMKKGGKRLLIIPPALAYGTQGVSERIPPNSALLVHVQVVRVKLQNTEPAKESLVSTTSSIPLPMLVNLPEQDEFDEPVVKGRTRSINEHLLHSPDSSKAKLISRIARMGQPMLPLQGGGADQEDSSDEDINHHQMVPPVPTKPPLPAKKPRSMTAIGMVGHAEQVPFSQTPAAVMQHGVAMVGSHPVVVTSPTNVVQHQQQPAFLQNLPGTQQLAVYQNPNTFLQQQQQAAMIHQQQQAAMVHQQQQAAAVHQQQQAVILQQQQLLQQQQQQLLSQSLSTTVGASPGHASAFGVPFPPVPPPAPPPALQTSSSSTADSITPVLLTESRQQNTDIRLDISKISDKIDTILEKVQNLGTVGLATQTPGMISPYNANMSTPSLEASVLMQNVTRIVQENERLKLEVLEQSNKVQEQNDKIASMLDRNQKYVERSHSLLEERNEGYRTTASHSQAKVLALEQEKIQLATELSTCSAQISKLQLELGDSRKREGELKQQLQMTSTSSTSSREELTRLQLQRDENEHKISNLNATVREEKQIRKVLETKLASLQEELTEIRTAKELIEKNLNERKRKAAEDKKKMEEDMEQTKKYSEKTIEDLQEKLRKQKSSLDAEIHSKVSKAEEEIAHEWQRKCDRMMATAAEKHGRQLSDLKDEKVELAQKVSELEKKVVAVRSAGSNSEKQVTQLKDELAEMKLWKDKYDSVRKQAATLKERYEKKIKEIEREKVEEERLNSEVVEQAREQRQQQQQKLQQLQQEFDSHRAQAATLKESYEKSIEELAKEKEAEKAKRIEVVEKARKLRLRQQQKIQQSQQEVQQLQTELLVTRAALEEISAASILSTSDVTTKQTTQHLVDQTSEEKQASVEKEESLKKDERTKEEDKDDEVRRGDFEVKKDEKLIVLSSPATMPTSVQTGEPAPTVAPTSAAIHKLSTITNVPISVTTNVPTTVPSTVSINVLSTVPITVPISVQNTISTIIPTTAPTTVQTPALVTVQDVSKGESSQGDNHLPEVEQTGSTEHETSTSTSVTSLTGNVKISQEKETVNETYPLLPTLDNESRKHEITEKRTETETEVVDSETVVEEVFVTSDLESEKGVVAPGIGVEKIVSSLETVVEKVIPFEDEAQKDVVVSETVPEVEASEVHRPETEGDKNIIVSKTEAEKTLVVLEKERDEFVTPDTEVDKIVSERDKSVTTDTEVDEVVPEREIDKFVTSDTEENKVVVPEKEIDKFVTSDTEVDEVVVSEKETDKFVTSDTEENKVVPNREIDKFVTSDTEENKIVVPEKEIDKFVTSDTEVDEVVVPEKEIDKFVTSDTEVDEVVPEKEMDKFVASDTDVDEVVPERETDTFVTPDTEVDEVVPEKEIDKFITSDTEVDEVVEAENEVVITEIKVDNEAVSETEAGNEIVPETEAENEIVPETGGDKEIVESEIRTETAVIANIGGVKEAIVTDDRNFDENSDIVSQRLSSVHESVSGQLEQRVQQSPEDASVFQSNSEANKSLQSVAVSSDGGMENTIRESQGENTLLSPTLENLAAVEIDTRKSHSGDALHPPTPSSPAEVETDQRDSDTLLLPTAESPAEIKKGVTVTEDENTLSPTLEILTKGENTLSPTLEILTEGENTPPTLEILTEGENMSPTLEILTEGENRSPTLQILTEGENTSPTSEIQIEVEKDVAESDKGDTLFSPTSETAEKGEINEHMKQAMLHEVNIVKQTQEQTVQLSQEEECVSEKNSDETEKVQFLVAHAEKDVKTSDDEYTTPPPTPLNPAEVETTEQTREFVSDISTISRSVEVENASEISSEEIGKEQSRVIGMAPEKAVKESTDGGISPSLTDESLVTRQTLQTTSSVATPTSVSDLRKPLPLFDDEDDDDSPLFGRDNTVFDTFGTDFKPSVATADVDVKQVTISETSTSQGKAASGINSDLVTDKELKPETHPPLFGDDSDDDLDWLS